MTDKKTSHIIPAQPGYFKLTPYIIDGVAGFHQDAIIAWQITQTESDDSSPDFRTHVEPVTFDNGSNTERDTYNYILSPNGVISWDEGTATSIEAWLQRAQEDLEQAAAFEAEAAERRAEREAACRAKGVEAAAKCRAEGNSEVQAQAFGREAYRLAMRPASQGGLRLVAKAPF